MERLKQWLRRWRRIESNAAPWNEAQRRYIREHVPAYSQFGEHLCRQYEAEVTTLCQARRWEGCEGLVVTDDMRMLVSAHAALMLLGARNYHFRTVNTILIYPGVIHRNHLTRQAMVIGEAWDNGGIVLSWSDVRAISRFRSGRNVVIHEFAHHLDGLDGEMGGSIPFHSPQDQQAWERVSSSELRQLVIDIQNGTPTLIDAYGATNRAEFFAVSSELFFERPHEMQSRHGELYELLMQFYQVDPRDWAILL